MSDTLDWEPIVLTLRLAAVTVSILVLLGTPLAWWLAHTRSRLKAPVEALTALPLVLPPSALMTPEPDSCEVLIHTEPPEPSPEAVPDPMPPSARMAPSTTTASSATMRT